ncbi:hypothetical protein [Leptospira kirschneri]|uniref:Uncharacterized protein n=1 Tax=Leptospira kirschneri serovar Bulgarica str. Nikolaevo TaxID=1240687 RepID=M6FHV7_9LEPT|nr:hypothetical protein [Leptospira kirschneri]EMK22376.1 hypothetical protein LEP1GSC008_1553 [Leptospira kirschneri serovar Bulgarica str. Nikolaevo]EMK24550.1 hypothetical protein LEP1GSC008_2626 [Leptospira kirschneri serovar Bulgarica str. Nikolaevo]EMK24865.1 hypothetical protein LEP1GSC008_0604 [Leptospira kirschneri serovar Bulgarica str. Nikolaevo]
MESTKVSPILRVFKVYLFDGASAFITKDPALIADVISDSEPGEDLIRIEVIEMTEHEYVNLPEWDGP